MSTALKYWKQKPLSGPEGFWDPGTHEELFWHCRCVNTVGNLAQVGEI